MSTDDFRLFRPCGRFRRYRSAGGGDIVQQVRRLTECEMVVVVATLATLLAQDMPVGSDLATVRYFAPGDPRPSTIEVTNDWPVEASPPTREQFASITWYAKQTGRNGTTVLDSRACPAIGELARSFRELPPIAPQPHGARILGDLPADLRVIIFPSGPTVTFKTYAATVEVSSVGPISAWGSELVSAFVACESEAPRHE